MDARRYLAYCLIFFLALSLITVAINYRVDPYLVFGSARTEGFNKIKADINEHVRLSKAYYPKIGEWDILLAGNSRIEMGLNPRHHCFKELQANVYNLGIPGAGVGQQLGYALDIIYEQPVKEVFLSVDFVDFLIPGGTSPPSDQADWMANKGLRYRFDGSRNPDYRWNRTQDYFRALFSLDALVSSVRTVISQSVDQPDRDDFGFNPANDFRLAVTVEGPNALFAQKTAVLEAKYAKPWGLSYRDGSLARDFAILDEFLDIAESREIRVTLFTNPFHENFWSLLRRQGLHDLHDQWLGMLVEHTRRRAASAVLWDFSMDSEFIHEKVPAPGVKSGPLRWFWEPSHYRRELGDLMLDTMLADRCTSEAVFGKELR